MRSDSPERRRPAMLLAGLLTVSLLALGLAPSARAGLATGDEAWLEFTALPAVSVTPDHNTLVYQAVYSASPAHETIIRGHAPAARYWSFAILDAARREVANISDYEVGVDADGRYEVTIRHGCGDHPDCLDVSGSAAPLAPDRILYRLYVPGVDAYGGVPLPQVVYRSLAGDELAASPVPAGLAQQLHAASTAELRPGGALHERMAAPTGLARPVAEGSTGADPQPERFQGLGAPQVQQLREMGAPAVVVDAADEARGQGGFGATQDNAYVTIAYAARFGDLLIRAKPPTYAGYPKGRGGLARPSPAAQTRYWSLCSTQGTRTVDCLRDEHVVVDTDGFFEILVTPDCSAADAPNCLRMGAIGGSGNGSVLYRNLLARDGFANANGPHECPSLRSQFCGDYAPVARYVPRP